jgi:hypothetical protein
LRAGNDPVVVSGNKIATIGVGKRNWNIKL